ncbi:MAG TPA: DNA polymerase III subunit gamma/tau [Vicinamibacterales bacterium]
MATYQVLARKWRPQRFEDVIGQRGVTQTLRNAIAANRIAQSFVFSGPRGVGKTTTARILARGLNCEKGPTADPCGVCDACVEIAQGRDMDVLEIDAATNTQVDKVREVIIAGLGMAPVRDRYKIFIIDEVHRLSNQAFDALLKSIEEPPPHVVFMMATTEIEKVPATIQSRSQVFELKAIGLKYIADQLRKIADAEKIEVDDAALMLIARAGDGSMRDAQSAFDQVIAFSGDTLVADDVSTVLGLVRRDLLLDVAEAVAREDAAAIFDLAAQSVESGYDLRLVIRELARLTRDLLVVNIDATRISDPEICAEGDRERVKALAAQFSAEDLMRAFEVLTKADYEIRGSAQPRFHLEMALLRWIHLRKLVPISDLIEGLETGSAFAKATADKKPVGAPARPAMPASPRPVAAPAARPVAPARPASNAATVRAVEARKEAAKPAAVGEAPAFAEAPAGKKGSPYDSRNENIPHVAQVAPAEIKDAFLAEVRKAKKFFYGTVVAQAQRIDVEPDRVVFTFAPQHRALRSQLDQSKTQLETLASELAGRHMAVVSVEGTAVAAPPRGGAPAPAAAPEADRKAELKQQALADSSVQAMLDVFAAEIRDVEEIDKG